MDRLIEFSQRSVSQLQRILTFYDERNQSDAYSRRLMRCLLTDLEQVAQMPTIGHPSTLPDVRFIYVMNFTVIYRYSLQCVRVLSIRSSLRKPLKLYCKK